MSGITVREIDFRFDPDIKFCWNPGNPEWGNFVNVVTMIVPAFERYLIRSTRAAIHRISDSQLARQAGMIWRATTPKLLPERRVSRGIPG